MKKISTLDAGRDNRGRSKALSFRRDGDVLEMLILQGGKVDTKISFSSSSQQKLLRQMFEVQQDIIRNQSAAETSRSVNELSTGQKVDLIQELSSSISGEELRSLSGREKERLRQAQPSFAKVMYAGSEGSSQLEKTKEHVQELIYEKFGGDWFTPSEFKEVYHANYEQGKHTMWLNRLNEQALQRKDASEHGVEDGRVNYVYRLKPETIEYMQQYEGLASESNPNYARKMGAVNR